MAATSCCACAGGRWWKAAAAAARDAEDGCEAPERRETASEEKLAGMVPVPVAATMAGSACCSSHSMVSPSVLWPSSRVSWNTRAAHSAGIRIRRPRPSTLVCRSLVGRLLPLPAPAAGTTATAALFFLSAAAAAAPPPPDDPAAGAAADCCASCCTSPAPPPAAAGAMASDPMNGAIPAAFAAAA
ncbi:hypothetical protein BDA96_05G060400 [Sorghum bicolor]|uniref:Uncharacterized protein n=1 Tax=Sorghum bicolor TaxID=4558 RepID=A0A921QV69_SORBI|nr:hypothetical protein BDA96_05G060400 [Sorghum bicolor]